MAGSSAALRAIKAPFKRTSGAKKETEDEPTNLAAETTKKDSNDTPPDSIEATSTLGSQASSDSMSAYKKSDLDEDITNKDNSNDASNKGDLDEDAIDKGGTDDGSNIQSALPQRTGKFVPQWLPPPVASQSTILLLGSVLFSLAYLWPPLILFVTYAASLLIPRCYRTNDSGCDRRRLFAQFVNGQQRSNADGNQTLLTPPASYTEHPCDGICVQEKYWVNQRGMCLCTAIMTPRTRTQAVVFFCHGYSDHSSYMKRVEHTRLVQQGIAVVYIEYEGHGRSDGTLCSIPNWELLVDDVAAFFHETAHQPEFAKLPFFLMGESMGGAVIYSVYNRLPYLFRGVIFMSPMCKISPAMLPPPLVVAFLTWLSESKNPFVRWIGTLPLTPTDAKLGDLCYRVREKRYVVDNCPTVYARPPRLVTARTLVDTTQQISKTMADFDAPFIIMHGQDDKVTDPKLSQALYDEAKSKDKTIKLYEGMWHSLVHGETDENVDKVLQDAIDWIKERC